MMSLEEAKRVAEVFNCTRGEEALLKAAVLLGNAFPEFDWFTVQVDVGGRVIRVEAR